MILFTPHRHRDTDCKADKTVVSKQLRKQVVMAVSDSSILTVLNRAMRINSRRR